MKIDMKKVKIAFASEILDTENLVCKEWQNLKIVIYIQEGNVLKYIAKRDLEENNISEEILFKSAEENTNKDWAVAQICNFLIPIKYPIEYIEKLEKDDIFALTNDEVVNGAIGIYFKENIEKIAEYLQGDFFIIPSSIHEVMILPKKKNMSPLELNECIKAVNEVQVEPNIRLANNCYYYSYKSKQIFYQLA